MTERNGSGGFDRILRAMGPFVAMAAMGGMMAARKQQANRANSGNGGGNWGFDKFDCNFAPGPGPGGKFRFNGREGVSLAELDMAADAPGEIVLSSSDHVVIEAGDDFAITLQGSDSAKNGVRFALEDGTLFIMRDGRAPATDEPADTGADDTPATITICMPPPRKLTLIGSGEIVTGALADAAMVQIGGSGRVRASGIAAAKLEVSVAGSGQFEASGSATTLDLLMAGSGDAAMAGLLVDQAKVSIAGSGNAVFASDGEVKARLLGSGSVTVRGGARCKVHSIGSGSLICERRDEPAT